MLKMISVVNRHLRLGESGEWRYGLKLFTRPHDTAAPYNELQYNSDNSDGAERLSTRRRRESYTPDTRTSLNIQPLSLTYQRRN